MAKWGRGSRAHRSDADSILLNIHLFEFFSVVFVAIDRLQVLKALIWARQGSFKDQSDHMGRYNFSPKTVRVAIKIVFGRPEVYSFCIFFSQDFSVKPNQHFLWAVAKFAPKPPGLWLVQSEYLECAALLRIQLFYRSKSIAPSICVVRYFMLFYCSRSFFQLKLCSRGYLCSLSWSFFPSLVE